MSPYIRALVLEARRSRHNFVAVMRRLIRAGREEDALEVLERLFSAWL
jgi:pentatricopeptide repeat protein